MRKFSCAPPISRFGVTWSTVTGARRVVVRPVVREPTHEAGPIEHPLRLVDRVQRRLQLPSRAVGVEVGLPVLDRGLQLVEAPDVRQPPDFFVRQRERRGVRPHEREHRLVVVVAAAVPIFAERGDEVVEAPIEPRDLEVDGDRPRR